MCYLNLFHTIIHTIVRVYESANFVHGLKKEKTHIWRTYGGKKSKFFVSNKLSGYKHIKKTKDFLFTSNNQLEITVEK